jgi:hypothetical protein
MENEIFHRRQKIVSQFLVRPSRTQSDERMKYLDSKGEDKNE